MHNFSRLTTHEWVTDHGFRKALEADPGTMQLGGVVIGPGRRDVVAYWQQEKSEYPLWELLCYMGSHTVPQTLAYFDLPADTVAFLRWCYNHVAHEERERVQGLDPGLAGGFEQMNFFPYPALYALWQRETPALRQARRGNVLVYLDRLTEPDGRELMRLNQVAFFD